MNQRVMLTRRLIKEALLRLLKKDDIYHVTVKEICGEAEINRSTFYAHFGSPRDVLLEIEQDAANDIRKIGPCAAKKDIREHLEKVCDYLYAHRETQEIIMRNNTDDDLAVALTNSAFSVCMPSSYIAGAGKDETETDFAYTFICYGMYHVIRKWLLLDIAKTPKEVSEIMSRLLMKQI